jgi:hypothetical protein
VPLALIQEHLRSLLGNTSRRQDALSDNEARQRLAEVQQLIDAIEPCGTLASLRVRAILGLIGYVQTSLKAALAMQVRDYYQLGDTHWVRLVEDGVERKEWVNRRLQQYMDEYLAAAHIMHAQDTPLFRSTFYGSHNIARRHSMSYSTAVEHITRLWNAQQQFRARRTPTNSS